MINATARESLSWDERPSRSLIRQSSNRSGGPSGLSSHAVISAMALEVPGVAASFKLPSGMTRCEGILVLARS